MIHTDGTPTVADPRSDRLVLDTERALEKLAEVGAPTTRTVIIEAHVRITNTVLTPEEWRDTVEHALRTALKLAENAGDTIDAHVHHVS